jgi:S1-C subfamily serine protease
VTPAAALPAAEQSVVNVFERLTYSVVNVVDITVAQAGLSRPGAQVDVPEGNGTGIVWDSEGDIVTNYHVLGGVLNAASSGRNGTAGRRVTSVARVTLLGSDGKSHEYVAELVGADRAKDIAVLRIAAPPELLRPLPRGQSARVRVGQTVLAIGNPFGFDHTLTTGVVSGLDRTVQSAVGSLISGGIQTDAAINPGNSGGPLLNSEGELIGLNTAIFTPTGLSAGVGFAIPVDTVSRVVPQLIQFGRVVRPSLNCALAPESIASQLRVKGGALVQAVPPGSNAAAAGLLPTRRGLGGIVTGDVIVGVDDDPVRSPAELADVIERHAIGDRVTLRVVRGVGGEAQELLIDVPVVLEKEAGAPE